MNSIRQATYALLARLFLTPPTEELLQQLSTLPPFDSVLSDMPMNEETVEQFQVYYQELFGFNFFPYESLFHDSELMVNSASTHRVARLMEQSTFDSSAYMVGAVDHLGVELAFMAYLIGREIEGEERQLLWLAQSARQLQATLIHHHLATWVPIAMLTIRRIAPAPLFRLLAEVTLELILSDLATIPETDGIVWVAEGATTTEVATSEDEEVGLSLLIRQLITPAECGLFLTRADIRLIARSLNLPSTMADRFGMVKQLFEAAGQFEQIEPLLTALEQQWHQAEQEMDAVVAAAPQWISHGQRWLSALKEGRSVLADLRNSWEGWEGDR